MFLWVSIFLNLILNESQDVWVLEILFVVIVERIWNQKSRFWAQFLSPSFKPAQSSMTLGQSCALPEPQKLSSSWGGHGHLKQLWLWGSRATMCVKAFHNLHFPGLLPLNSKDKTRRIVLPLLPILCKSMTLILRVEVQVSKTSY